MTCQEFRAVAMGTYPHDVPRVVRLAMYEHFAECPYCNELVSANKTPLSDEDMAENRKLKEDDLASLFEEDE